MAPTAKAKDSKCSITIDEDVPVVCVFCKSSKRDEINWGNMYGTEGVYTHYFCMLFAAALKQNGADEDGILGFLAADILKEVKRCARLKCVFCGQLGASVGCCNKRCKAIFHFPCGLENEARNKFHSTFESFCRTHAKLKPLVLSDTTETCPICMCTVDASERLVKGTCCKASLFHKECIQKMALSAGYLFKCPTCNKTKQFIHEMRGLGIFVPDQDASWEQDNRFQDLYVRYSHCDAEECSCSRGRKHVDEKGKWSLARCRLCGAAGVHRRCGKLSDSADVGKWACQPCLDVEKKTDSKPKPVPEVPKPTTSRAAAASSITQSTSRKYKPVDIYSQSIPEEDDDESFSLAQCYISSRCFSYFPYSRNTLRKMKTKTLPDWREMELRVNLVKWLPGMYLEQEAEAMPSTSSIPSSGPEPTSNCGTTRYSRSPSRSIELTKRKRSRSRSIADLEAEEVMADMLELELQKELNLPPKKHRRSSGNSTRRKKTLWSTGVDNREASQAKARKKKKCSKTRDASPISHASSLEFGEPETKNPECNQLPDRVTLTLPFDTATSSSIEMSELVSNYSSTNTNTSESEPNNSESEINMVRESEAEPEESEIMEMEELFEIGVDEIEVIDACSTAFVPEVTPAVETLIEPTVEQMNSFKALGDRLRSELSQNNIRENELSPPRKVAKLGQTASTEGNNNNNIEFNQRRKQWFCPEIIKERQVLVGDPEL